MRYRHLSYRAAIWHLLLPFAFRLQCKQQHSNDGCQLISSIKIVSLSLSPTVFQDSFALYTPPLLLLLLHPIRAVVVFLQFPFPHRNNQHEEQRLWEIYISQLTILIELECPFLEEPSCLYNRHPGRNRFTKKKRKKKKNTDVKTE